MVLGLKGKIALVTASSQGIGKATAESLASEGATVIICSRRKAEIHAAAREISTRTGSAVIGITADVSVAADIRKLIAAIKRKFGTIHILVNNAGGPPTGDILTMSDDDWRKGFELTLMSTVRLTREVLPFMIRQKWGRVITITSITAKQPISELLLSSVFRPGLLGLTKVLSNTQAAHNITINTVCPGFVLTNRQKELMDARSAKSKVSMEEYMKNVVRDIPAGRMAEPREIGDVIAFLASEKAGYVSGANLLVDGGLARGIH